MAQYVDGFLIPVPTRKLPAYRRIAKVACKVWLDHGALDYRECVGDDLNIKGVRPFAQAAACKRGETVLFSWIAYRSRAHRDRVNALVMKDPRMKKFMDGRIPMPFDCKRMCYAGFSELVAGQRKRA